MKRALMILGGVFLVLIVVLIAGIAIVAVKGRALDKESKQYADAAIPAIVSDWETKELEQRASPELNSVLKHDDLQKLFAMCRRLGKLKEYKGCQGDANISVTSAHGKVISAAYTSCSEFEAGSGTIRLSLIKHGDQWQILAFHVDSKAFLEQP